MKNQIQFLFLIAFFVLLSGCKSGSFTSHSLHQVSDNSASGNSQEGNKTEDDQTTSGNSAGNEPEGGGQTINEPNLPTCESPSDCGGTQSETTTKTNVIERVQPLNQLLDVIVVVDHSPSMEDHQEEFSERFQNISTQLEGIDWQMAFISTDSAENGLFHNLRSTEEQLSTKVLSSSSDLTDIDRDDIFLNTVLSFGANGSNKERPLANIVNAINQNKGFFRENATFAVIILSNEDEEDEGDSTTQPIDVITAVSNQLGSDKMFFAYGIIIQPENLQCLTQEREASGNHARTGHLIASLASQTGGDTKSICEENYSAILKDIGTELEARVSLKEIPLNHQNVVEISSVSVLDQNGQTVTYNGWSFDQQNNKILLNTPLQAGQRIRIEYTYEQ